MKILSRNIGGGHFFNLEKLPDKESREDISMIIDYIKNANADIVLLQEMHLEDTGEIPNRDFWNSLGFSICMHNIYSTAKGFLDFKILWMIESINKPLEYGYLNIMKNIKYSKRLSINVIVTKKLDIAV